MCVSTYESKLAEAQEIVTGHNGRLPDDAERLDWATILKKLKGMGGTTSDALAAVTWEDLQDCGLPRILARQIAAGFRKKNEPSSKPLKTSAVAALNLRELVGHYDVSGETNSLVAERLVKESKGLAFLVPNAAGDAIDVDRSVELLRELRDGHDPREFVVVDGDPRPVFRVGERLDWLADENPLFPGKMLSGQTCRETDRSWEGVSLETRQIVYLAAAQTGELDNSDLGRCHDILDMVLTPDGQTRLRSRCPKAVYALKELTETGNAPTLKIRRKPRAGGSSKLNDPFGTHRRY